MKKPIKIAITGATGAISYSALFRLASGEAFGCDQPILLSLYDLPGTEKIMEGLAMELEDCCTPLITGIEYHSDLDQAFKEVDYALLIGAKPRGPGMERGDLLTQNGAIFVKQGEALNRVAKRSVVVVVVGNPCNTNCLVSMHHAPDLPQENFHALMMLDQHRATALLAHQASVAVDQVSKVVVWGNHSATQVPDASHVIIKGQGIEAWIHDRQWIETTFMQTVQKRGSQVIEHLKRSSAASAARAAVEILHKLYVPTEPGQWFTSGVCTNQAPYPLEKNLIFGLPCHSYGNGQYSIVPHIEWNEYIKDKIRITEKELMSERECCIKEGLI